MRFVFPHSHAFPRGRVTVEDDGSDRPDRLVEFGVEELGGHVPAGGEIVLGAVQQP